MDDYLDPSSTIGTDEDKQGFHRRLLQVFRDSQDDFAYEEWLAKLQPDEQKRIQGFVDGDSAERAGREYMHGLSLGVREHIEELVKRGAKPVVVKGLNDKRVQDSDRKKGLLREVVDDLIEPFMHHHHEYSSIVSHELPSKKEKGFESDRPNARA